MGEVTSRDSANATGAKPTFSVLDPRADQDALDVVGLAPRVSSLDGKTLYLICIIDAKWDFMHYAREIKKQVPTCNIVFAYDVQSQSLGLTATKPVEDPAWTWASIKAMEKDHQKADAAIACIGW